MSKMTDSETRQSNNCLGEQRECFLTSEAWEEACNPASLGITGIAPPLVTAIGEFKSILAHLTTVLLRSYRIIDALRVGEPVDPDFLAAQYQRASSLRARIQKWFPEINKYCEAPYEKLSEDPNSLWPVILWWPNKWYGSMSMGVWASLLITQETLKVCTGGTEDYTEHNKEVAAKILRSVECVAQGLTGKWNLPRRSTVWSPCLLLVGPYRVGMALRVAFEFCDVPQKRWVHGVLERQKTLYGAAAPQGYPDAEPSKLISGYD